MRFKHEDIGRVSLLQSGATIEYCAIEANTGIVHWLDEVEFEDVFTKVKTRAKGTFKSRYADELEAFKAQDGTKDAALQTAAQEIQKRNQKIAELQQLVLEAQSAISELKLKVSIKEAKAA
jgi:hypothetical protein